MNRINPIYIPRNHLVEEALKAAVGGDLEPFHKLLAVLAHPFTEQDGSETLALPDPVDGHRHVTFCGT